MGELDRIERDALAELKEDIQADPLNEDWGDRIFEIADSHCPIYTSTILQLAADNLFLATEEPELGPAFDGSPTPVNIITANIFEHIYQCLWENLEDLQEEVKEELLTCFECGDIIDDDRLIGHEEEDKEGNTIVVCSDCYDDYVYRLDDDNQILP